MTKLASLRGFEDGRYVVGEADYFVAQGGAGPPLLLLHGVGSAEPHAEPRSLRPRTKGRRAISFPA
jgi:hypothetical protein